jgi:hypothetical protein
LIFCVIAAGCGAGGGKNDVATTPPTKPADPATRVNVGSGSAMRRLEGEGRQRAWSIRWESAQIEYGDDENFGGEMTGVSGTLYRDDQAVGTFRADQAIADKKTSLLTMRGNVRLAATDPESTLHCGELQWLADEDLVKAKDRVRLESEFYTAGEFGEVWARPDLSRIASPETFHKG